MYLLFLLGQCYALPLPSCIDSLMNGEGIAIVLYHIKIAPCSLIVLGNTHLAMSIFVPE